MTRSQKRKLKSQRESRGIAEIMRDQRQVITRHRVKTTGKHNQSERREEKLQRGCLLPFAPWRTGRGWIKINP